MKRYELVVIFQQNTDDAELQAQIGKIEAVTKQHAGTIVRQEIWGRRQLAYKIERQTFGLYVSFVLEGDSRLVADLDRQLKINEAVIRHLVVSKDKYAPDGRPRTREDEDLPTLGGGDDFEIDDMRV